MEGVTKTETQHYARQLWRRNNVMSLAVTESRVVNEFTVFNQLPRMGITA